MGRARTSVHTGAHCVKVQPIAVLCSRAPSCGAVPSLWFPLPLPPAPRYTHDPNPRVQEAMVAIWRALVDDPRATLEK